MKVPSNTGEAGPVQHSDKLQSLMALAHAHLTAGRIDEAGATCEAVLRLHQRLPAANFLLAMVAVRKHDRRSAIVRLREVVNTDANAFEALEWLANLLREEREYEESMYLCGHMIRRYPKNPGGPSTMGLCLLDKGESKEAVHYLKLAADLGPQVPVFHFHLARALEREGATDDAAREFSIAIGLAPEVGAHYEAYGEMLYRRARRPAAIKNLSKAVDLDPTPNALLLLASALADDGRPNEAEQYLTRAIACDPTNAQAHEVYGQALEVLGRFDESIEHFQLAMELDPALAGPLLGLTRCRRISEADIPLVSRLEAMAQRSDQDEESLRKIHYALGKSYNDLGKYEKALTHYDSANNFALKVQLKGKKFDVNRYRSWINALIRTFTKPYIAAHRGSGLLTDKPIFIVGMIRSGTTLTEQILSSHPDVAPGGEIKFWTDQDRTNFIQRITRSDGSNDDLAGAAKAYLDLLNGISRESPRVTDKMPLNFMALGLIQTLFPNAKIIHCRRKPVDNCLSIYITPYDLGAEFCYDRASIVAAYREYSRVMQHWREVLSPDSLLEVDYEALVADQEGVARQMVAFCGLDWSDDCLRHYENERTVRTPSRWQVRQPIYNTAVERWRRYEPWLGEFLELRNE